MDVLRDTLTGIAKIYGTDKLTPGFVSIYDLHFTPIRDNVKSLLEIGVHQGRSLQMWRDYFHNCPVVTGWDIFSFEIDEFGPKVVTAVVNQERLSESAHVLKSQYTFDVIIEDGSHTMKGQQETLGHLWHLLKPGGTYIMEDLHTSLPHNIHEWHGGGCRENFSNSSLEAIKRLATEGVMRSEYMTETQMNTIESEIASCRIFDVLGDERHITAIITKKVDL